MANPPLPVTGTSNLRDLGGYRADGGTIRPGVIFRSDTLAGLDRDGRDQLADLGVERVIDLRDDSERANAPDALDERMSLIPNPIFPSAGAHVARQLDVISLTEIIYFEHADTLVSALRLLLPAPGEGRETPAGATLFHCTAGKDRTGAVAALALLVAGVDRDDVIDDYVASEANLRGPWLDAHLDIVRGHGVEITPEIRGLIGSTPPQAIDGALRAIDARYGGARDYLRAAGMVDAEFERLHAALVAA